MTTNSTTPRLRAPARPCLAAGLLVACAWAHAAPPASPPATASGGFGTALDRAALDAERVHGNLNSVIADVDMRGDVRGNTAQGVVSGDNRIDGTAFANSAGLTTVIQNSGSNVLIQAGTAINVQFVDPMP